MPKACTQVFAPESLSMDLEAFESLHRIKRHTQKLLAAKLRKHVPSFAEASAAEAAAVAALNTEQQDALIAAGKKQRGEAKAARKKELQEKRDHERQLKLELRRELESKKEELTQKRAEIEARWKDEQAQIAAIHENLNALNEQKHEAVLKLKQVLHTEVTLRRQSSSVQQINMEQQNVLQYQASGQPPSPYPMPNMILQQQGIMSYQVGMQHPASSLPPDAPGPFPPVSMLQPGPMAHMVYANNMMQQPPLPLHPIPSPRAPSDPPPCHPSSYSKPIYHDSPYGAPQPPIPPPQPPPQLPPQPPPQPSSSPSGFGSSSYPPLPAESKPNLPRGEPPSRQPSVADVARREGAPIRPPLGEPPLPSSSPRTCSIPSGLPRRGSSLSSRDLRAEGEIEASELTPERHAPADRMERASDEPYPSRADSSALRRISPERRRSSHDLRYDPSKRSSPERRPERSPDPRGPRGASSSEPRRGGSDAPSGRHAGKPSSHLERGERSDSHKLSSRRPAPSSSDSSSSDEGEISEEGEVKYSPCRSSSPEDGIDPSCIRPSSSIRTPKGPPPQMLPPHLSRSGSAGHSPRESAGGSWSHPPPPPFGTHLPPHLKHGDGFSSRGTNLPSPMGVSPRWRPPPPPPTWGGRGGREGHTLPPGAIPRRPSWSQHPH